MIDKISNLNGNTIDSSLLTLIAENINTVASAAIHTMAVPILWYFGTNKTVIMAHTITPAIPAFTIYESFLSGINNCNTMIFSAPITISCSIIIRIGRIAPSYPYPAKICIMSGANSSTKHIIGQENRNSNLNAVSVYCDTKSNRFSLSNMLILGIITPVNVLINAITT